MSITAAPASRLTSLPACARYFAARATPRILVPLLVAAVAARVVVGGWGWADLVVAVAILAFEPFTEWLIHVHVLHARPRTVAGRTWDLHAARKHRAHHADPNDPRTSFVPLPDLAAALGIGAGVFWLLTRDLGPFLTAEVVALAMLLTYEWTHYLIHTGYRPTGGYYRSIWRSHRLHHFRNEHYWMGVTVNLGDRVLGTFPDRHEVPVSPTARSLGIET